MSQIIYLDNAATTRCSKKVLEKMLPYMSETYANPSSIHCLGRNARKVVETSRCEIASILNCKPEEIFFTSGGTESDNWALKGTALANANKGKHIITSQIEHHAVLNACKYLEEKGFKITYLPVDEHGTVSVEEFKNSINKDTILISIMYANNEIGTIQPIKEISNIAVKKNIIFHTDAVQSIGNCSLDLSEINIDMLSVSAHKLYGPKGIGLLYIKKGTIINPFIHGGSQESNLRAGTINVPGIVGLSEALKLAYSDLDVHVNHIKGLRDAFIHKIMSSIDNVYINGHPSNRLPGNANLSFEYIEGESLLLSLDLNGICASSGSACSAGNGDISHVLKAVGIKPMIAQGALRFSFGRYNTIEDVDFTVKVIKESVEKLRQMSPLFVQERGGCKYV